MALTPVAVALSDARYHQKSALLLCEAAELLADVPAHENVSYHITARRSADEPITISVRATVVGGNYNWQTGETEPRSWRDVARDIAWVRRAFCVAKLERQMDGATNRYVATADRDGFVLELRISTSAVPPTCTVTYEEVTETITRKVPHVVCA